MDMNERLPMTIDEAFINLFMIRAAYVEDTTKEQEKIIDDTFKMAANALNMVDNFERAQIITGGRLNGRTYAYKCGLEDGKRMALLEQELKIGRWIERRSRATGHIEVVCSECGAEIGHQYNKYCGNCGARMESEDKE